MRRASGKAVLSVILGPLGMPALLLGYWALRDINQSDGRIKGRALAVAGLVLGGLATLLWVVGIAAVWIVGLREKANRAACQNNLRVIGAAVNLYHGRKGPFPSGTIPNARLAPTERLSWYVSILHFLDQDPDRHRATQEQEVYAQVDRKLAWNAGVNRRLADTTMRWFICPSHAGGPPTQGLTYYVGIAGVGKNAATLPADSPEAGFFGYDRAIRRADVTHGLSRTMLATETEADNGPWARGGPATVRGLDPAQQPLIGPGRPFGGLHPGGLNVLFVDGAASYFTESIDPDVFEAMARIHGG